MHADDDLDDRIDDRNDDIESDADKRAHHNALERKRRDHIKDSFSSLRDALPAFQGDKVRASRAQILKKAADYIQVMRRKNTSHQQDIEDLKKQNKMLEEQIRTLEKAKATGNFAAAAAILDSPGLSNNKKIAKAIFDGETDTDSTDTDESKDGQRKRIKLGSNNSFCA